MPVADRESEIISQLFSVMESDEQQEMTHTPSFLVSRSRRDRLGAARRQPVA